MSSGTGNGAAVAPAPIPPIPRVERPRITLTRLDRIVIAGFAVGKLLSVVMMLIFFSVFLYAGYQMYETTKATSFKAPQFAKTHRTGTSETGKEKTDVSSITDKQKVQSKYGNRFKSIIENYSLNAGAYDWFEEWVIGTDKDYRDDLVDGLERYLADGVANAKKNGREPNIPELLTEYRRIFDSTLSEVGVKKAAAERDRMILYGVLGGSALLFFGFLMIPALLQIEKNTRVAVGR